MDYRSIQEVCYNMFKKFKISRRGLLLYELAWMAREKQNLGNHSPGSEPKNYQGRSRLTVAIWQVIVTDVYISV